MSALDILDETITKLSNADVRDKFGRTKYWDNANPMIQRRKNAFQAIYQFLKNENLISSLALIQKET